jgi:hypothetical protein
MLTVESREWPSVILGVQPPCISCQCWLVDLTHLAELGMLGDQSGEWPATLDMKRCTQSLAFIMNNHFRALLQFTYSISSRLWSEDCSPHYFHDLSDSQALAPFLTFDLASTFISPWWWGITTLVTRGHGGRVPVAPLSHSHATTALPHKWMTMTAGAHGIGWIGGHPTTAWLLLLLVASIHSIWPLLLACIGLPLLSLGLRLRWRR